MAERVQLFTTLNSLHATPNPFHATPNLFHATLNRIEIGQRLRVLVSNIQLGIQVHVRQLCSSK